jgi:hypothetical protein
MTSSVVAALFRLCTCGHELIVHAMSQKGDRRTFCTHQDGVKGACRCNKFTEATSG